MGTCPAITWRWSRVFFVVCALLALSPRLAMRHAIQK
jgi:hypothetical protein